MRILFVCTGNTCRSPMALALCERLGRDRGLALSCDAAGLTAHMGSPMAENAKRVLARVFGIEDFEHRAKPVTREMIEWADLVLAVTENHRRMLVQCFGCAHKTLTLPLEVGDPFGGDEAAYERAARAILAGLEALADQGVLHD